MRGYILRHNSSRTDDALITDHDTRQDDRVSPNKAISPNAGVGVNETGHVVRQNCRVKGDVGSGVNVDPARIGEVKICLEGEFAGWMDVHPQNASKVPSADRNCRVASKED